MKLIVQNITKTYSTRDKNSSTLHALKNISFEAESGEFCAIVGESGSGKSTVANLIARFWDIKSGTIKIRGTDIRDVPLSELMNNISMVFQRVYLFQDTVYNNIIMGKPDATEEEVYAAAKKSTLL